MGKLTLVNTLLAIESIKDDETLFRYKPLSLHMKVSKSRVTVLIDGLEADGYAKRVSPREVALTEKGKGEIAKIQADLARIHAKLATDMELEETEISEMAFLLYVYGSDRLLSRF